MTVRKAEILDGQLSDSYNLLIDARASLKADHEDARAKYRADREAAAEKLLDDNAEMLRELSYAIAHLKRESQQVYTGPMLTGYEVPRRTGSFGGVTDLAPTGSYQADNEAMADAAKSLNVYTDAPVISPMVEQIDDLREKILEVADLEFCTDASTNDFQKLPAIGGLEVNAHD